MGLNTLPTNRVPLAGAGGARLIPQFQPDGYFVSSSTSAWEGFNGDGDWITAVGTSTATLQYRDNTGSVIFSYAPSAVNASAVHWLSFSLDAVDNLLWVTTFNDTTDTVYLTTIDDTGTLTQVGSATTSEDLSSGDGWNGTNDSGASMHRDTPGQGNWKIHGFNFQFELDYTDGSLVSEDALVNRPAGVIRLSDTSFFGFQSKLEESGGNTFQDALYIKFFIEIPEDPDNYVEVEYLAPLDVGLPVYGNTTEHQPGTFLQWKGYAMAVYAGQSPLSAQSGYIKFTFSEIATKAALLASNMGVEI